MAGIRARPQPLQVSCHTQRSSLSCHGEFRVRSGMCCTPMAKDHEAKVRTRPYSDTSTIQSSKAQGPCYSLPVVMLGMSGAGSAAPPQPASALSAAVSANALGDAADRDALVAAMLAAQAAASAPTPAPVPVSSRPPCASSCTCIKHDKDFVARHKCRASAPGATLSHWPFMRVLSVAFGQDRRFSDQPSSIPSRKVFCLQQTSAALLWSSGWIL